MKIVNPAKMVRDGRALEKPINEKIKELLTINPGMEDAAIMLSLEALPEVVEYIDYCGNCLPPVVREPYINGLKIKFDEAFKIMIDRQRNP
jgi:hypothetical protein